MSLLFASHMTTYQFCSDGGQSYRIRGALGVRGLRLAARAPSAGKRIVQSFDGSCFFISNTFAYVSREIFAARFSFQITRDCSATASLASATQPRQTTHGPT